MRKLDKFDEDAVMFFPNIESSDEVEEYLHGFTSPDGIKQNTSNELLKLKELEDSGDVKFYDYFLKNFIKFPLFNDPYHPTQPFINFVAIQLMKKINENKGAYFDKINLNVEFYSKESVYFRPIKTEVSKSLGLNFDLDSNYIVDRKTFLTKIIDYENKNESKVESRHELFSKVLGL